VIVFKKVKKTQQTSINQCTVIQPYFCCNIHNGREALNYFGSRQVTEFSQQLAILNPTIGFQVSVRFRISEKVTDSDAESVTSLQILLELFDIRHKFLHENSTLVLTIYFHTSINEMKINALQRQHSDKHQ